MSKFGWITSILSGGAKVAGGATVAYGVDQATGGHITSSVGDLARPIIGTQSDIQASNAGLDAMNAGEFQLGGLLGALQAIFRMIGFEGGVNWTEQQFKKIQESTKERSERVADSGELSGAEKTALGVTAAAGTAAAVGAVAYNALKDKQPTDRTPGFRRSGIPEDPMDVYQQAQNSGATPNGGSASKGGFFKRAGDALKGFRFGRSGVAKMLIGGAAIGGFTALDGATSPAQAAEAPTKFQADVDPTQENFGTEPEAGGLGNFFYNSAQVTGGIGHGVVSLGANTVGFGADAVDMTVGNLGRAIWNGGASLVGSDSRVDYKTTLDFTRASQDLVDQGAAAIGVDLQNEYANAASNITYGTGVAAGIVLTFIPSGGTSAAFGAAATGGRLATAGQRVGTALKAASWTPAVN